MTSQGFHQLCFPTVSVRMLFETKTVIWVWKLTDQNCKYCKEKFCLLAEFDEFETQQVPINENRIFYYLLSKLGLKRGNSWEEDDVLPCCNQKLNSVPVKWLQKEVTVICISITFIVLHPGELLRHPGELLRCVSSQGGLAFLIGWIHLASV